MCNKAAQNMYSSVLRTGNRSSNYVKATLFERHLNNDIYMPIIAFSDNVENRLSPTRPWTKLILHARGYMRSLEWYSKLTLALNLGRSVIYFTIFRFFQLWSFFFLGRCRMFFLFRHRGRGYVPISLFHSSERVYPRAFRMSFVHGRVGGSRSQHYPRKR